MRPSFWLLISALYTASALAAAYLTITLAGNGHASVAAFELLVAVICAYGAHRTWKRAKGHR